jgi:hypothetical protein
VNDVGGSTVAYLNYGNICMGGMREIKTNVSQRV